MKSGAVTVLNESNFNFNFNNNNKNNNSHQTKNKKSVRFAADESLQINKTGFTNTFKIGEYCKKCGSLRVGPFVEQGCKNCQIPKPSKRSSILTSSNNTKNNEYVDSFDLLNSNRRINKSEFLTRSFDNVDQNYKTYQNSPSQIYYQPKSPYQNNIYSSPSQIYYKQQERRIRPHTHYYSPRGTLTTEVEIENEIPEILERLSAGESLEEAAINARQPIMPVKPRTSLIRPIYKCHACNGILQPGETAIMAEKVDRNLRWHPGCFACTICNELLVDLLYFNIGSDVYCEKHFDEIISWRKCAACDLPIKSNEYVCAENNYWHIEHFVCWNCDCSLAGQKYTVIDSMPYCFTCHERIFAKPCQTCKKKILPDQVRLTYEKLNWHSDPNCFKCHVCNLGLLESHFLLKNNLLFCSLDCKKKAVKN